MSDVKIDNISETIKIDEQPNTSVQRHGKDLIFLFYSNVLITLGLMICQFIINKYDTYSNFNLPIDIFVNGLMYFVLIFGGFEGTVSFLKSASLPIGKSVKLPEWKIKQLFGYIITFMILTIISIVLQTISKKTNPSYFVESFAQATSASIVIYVAARTGSKIGENIILNSASKKETETKQEELVNQENK